MTQGLVSFVALISTILSSPSSIVKPVAGSFLVTQEGEVLGATKTDVLSSKTMDLSARYEESSFVNGVFGDNILLALHYLGSREKSREVDWWEVGKPFSVSFTLNPGEVFAFHKQALPEFKDKVVVTMNSRFYADEGYRNSGYIYGDGVCHLASLMNWAAVDAGLKVVAKASHDFRLIPGIPREYGTSIRYADSGSNTQNQNLYIENTKDFPIEFKFIVEKGQVLLTVLEK